MLLYDQCLLDYFFSKRKGLSLPFISTQCNHELFIAYCETVIHATHITNVFHK